MTFLLGVLAWVTVNTYLLPFSVWTAGIVRPWFIMQGLIPYRDFVWLRMPLDLFFMSGWYSIFGATPQSYQNFVFLLLAVIAIVLFLVSRMLFAKLYYFPFLFFAIFLFPLFQNTEVDEMMVGLWAILLFALMTLFFKKQKIKYLLFAGIISGLSLITKQTSGLIIVASVAGIIFSFILHKNTAVDLLNKVAVFGVGVLIPVLSLILYFIINHGLGDFLHYTILFNYSSIYEGWTQTGDGLWIVAGYVSLLLPFIVFWKKTKIIPEIAFFLILETICLFTSLLPSAISYKAFTSYSLISLVAGYNIVLLLSLKKCKMIIIFFFILFIIFTRNFILSYITNNPGFAPNQLLQDYNETQYEIANLVEKNTNSNDKIMSYGSEIIYLLANRLPQNKYVDPFPYMLKPYDVSLRTFKDNPPKIIVYDESLPNDHPGLADWPGIQFFRDKYAVIGKYDESFVVYKVQQ